MNLAGVTLAVAVIALAVGTSALIGVFRITRHPTPKAVRKPPPNPRDRVGRPRLTPDDTVVMGKRPTPPPTPPTKVAVRRQPITDTGRHRLPQDRLFTHPDQPISTVKGPQK